MKYGKLILGMAALAAMASPAMAHTGVGATFGFAHGFMHPLTGIDHVLAMVAVGLFAGQLDGRALWAVPATFVGMMIVGGVLGMNGVSVPFVEAGIALSVLVLGAVVALEVKLPVALAMAMAGLFAVFHGHAHGAEMPVGAGGLAYALGFIGATALLHAAGVIMMLALQHIFAAYSRKAAVLGGSAIALAGLGLVTGLL